MTNSVMTAIISQLFFLVLFSETKMYRASSVDQFPNKRLSNLFFFYESNTYSATSISYDFWMSDCFELVLFSESDIFSTTNVVRILNK